MLPHGELLAVHTELALPQGACYGEKDGLTAFPVAGIALPKILVYGKIIFYALQFGSFRRICNRKPLVAYCLFHDTMIQGISHKDNEKISNGTNFWMPFAEKFGGRLF